MFDDVYTNDLRDPDIGFTSVTTIALITHLHDYYGGISLVDLSQNKENIMVS